MIRVEFFCTRCNSSAVRRDPGDEVNTGYAVFVAANPDRAKVDIPLVPQGWTVVSGGLVCDACVAKDDEASAFKRHYDMPEDLPLPPRLADAEVREPTREELADLEREIREPSPGYPKWPARKSPFDVPMHD